jgi:hypothetical protein
LAHPFGGRAECESISSPELNTPDWLLADLKGRQPAGRMRDQAEEDDRRPTPADARYVLCHLRYKLRVRSDRGTLYATRKEPRIRWLHRILVGDRQGHELPPTIRRVETRS